MTDQPHGLARGEMLPFAYRHLEASRTVRKSVARTPGEGRSLVLWILISFASCSQRSSG